MDLLFWYNHWPRLPRLAKHLLSLKQLAAIEDLLFYGLGGSSSGVDGLLYSIDVRDNHARWRHRVGEAMQLDDARRVRLLRLARVALRQELHARRLPWVQRVVLYNHFREEFQHFLSARASRVFVTVFLNSFLVSWRRELSSGAFFSFSFFFCVESYLNWTVYFREDLGICHFKLGN
jgi:hypothetical protein